VSEGADPLGPRVQVQVHHTARTATWPPPRAVPPSARQVWSRLSPDPGRLLGFTESHAAVPAVDDVVSVRRRHIARSQRNYYRTPMNLVRGRDVWFHDEDGLAYLDSLNNVTHVGHAEPRVTAAATRQLRKLNTNSRFVYPQIASYVQKLVATLPDPLEVVFLVCTGSEANDLALRIARQVTGRQHIVNIDGAYHGNTGVVTGISPNRYKGPGGAGAPATTHEVVIPDRYRSTYGYDDPDAGAKYARDAAAVIERISADGRAPAAFIAESLMGSGGNIVFPDGYLDGVFTAARRAGALCVSDEVQVGVGRLGPWWGFELQGVVPDIVTMGKPLGNGHPLAAVVTTREIADAFDTGMKYFNTFGGNPVSCAIGEAVLDIVEQDGLRENAVSVGGYFAESLRELQRRQPLIGDVRAEGLYLGVELVRDRTTKVPATEQAFMVTELMKERGVIVFPNGVHDNVLKIKPPMTFRREHVDLYVDALDEVLSLPELRSAVQS
jgi:4-aminobutyrate aminotransferase-like enzyme